MNLKKRSDAYEVLEAFWLKRNRSTKFLLQIRGRSDQPIFISLLIIRLLIEAGVSTDNVMAFYGIEDERLLPSEIVDSGLNIPAISMGDRGLHIVVCRSSTNNEYISHAEFFALFNSKQTVERSLDRGSNSVKNKKH